MGCQPTSAVRLGTTVHFTSRIASVSVVVPIVGGCRLNRTLGAPTAPSVAERAYSGHIRTLGGRPAPSVGLGRTALTFRPGGPFHSHDDDHIHQPGRPHRRPRLGAICAATSTSRASPSPTPVLGAGRVPGAGRAVRRRRFRSTIDMARHRFGDGRYRYFDHPLPASVEAARPRSTPTSRRSRTLVGAACRATRPGSPHARGAARALPARRAGHARRRSSCATARATGTRSIRTSTARCTSRSRCSPCSRTRSATTPAASSCCSSSAPAPRAARTSCAGRRTCARLWARGRCSSSTNSPPA